MYLIKWNKSKPKRVCINVIERAGENFNQSEDPLPAVLSLSKAKYYRSKCENVNEKSESTC